MDDYTGMVVRSEAGHDKGQLFFVVNTEGDFLYLVNGRQRKQNKPKRKNKCHVSRVLTNLPENSSETVWDGKMDLPHSDPQFRRALAALKEVITFGER